MKRFIILFVLFLYTQLNFAQEATPKSRDLAIKLPVSSFFGDIFAESMGFGLGVEKMLENNWSVSQEASYIFHVKSTSAFTTSVNDIHGLKLTTELRKYLIKNEIPESGWFINTEMKNIFTKSHKQAWTTDNISVENEITRYRGLLLANFGFLVYWDKNKKGNVTLELMGGGGLAYVNASSSNDLRSKTSYSSEKGFYPWFNFDFKIGYVLK